MIMFFLFINFFLFYTFFAFHLFISFFFLCMCLHLVMAPGSSHEKFLVPFLPKSTDWALSYICFLTLFLFLYQPASNIISILMEPAWMEIPMYTHISYVSFKIRIIYTVYICVYINTYLFIYKQVII